MFASNNGIQGLFNKMITDRIIQIGDDEISLNKEYLDYTDEIIRLFNEITQHMPVEQKKLLLRYEELFGNRSLISERIIYEVGFKDAIQLKKVFEQ